MFKQKSEQEVFGDKNNNSSKKPLFKKIIFSIIGAVLLAVIISLLPNLLGIFSEDIAPINDSDLRLQVVTVSNNENAYFDLMKLDDVIYFPKEKKQIISDMIEGKVWDGEFAEEQISKNMQAYDYFSDASLKQKYQDPSWAKPENVTLGTELPPISNWYQMSQLSALRALYFTKQGMDKKAIDEALKSVIIGQKILESQVPMIEYVTAIEMKRIGLETLQKIITSSDLDSENLK